MSFVVIVADPNRPARYLADNKDRRREFTTLAKAERAARRASVGEVKAIALHKTRINPAALNGGSVLEFTA